MTDAPERIWAVSDGPHEFLDAWIEGWWHVSEGAMGGVEYVRADTDEQSEIATLHELAGRQADYTAKLEAKIDRLWRAVDNMNCTAALAHTLSDDDLEAETIDALEIALAAQNGALASLTAPEAAE